MTSFSEFIQNDTAMISGGIVLFTGLLTGPVFQMDGAAVGSITGILAFVFNIWVKYSVFSKKGAAKVATAAATEAVAAVSDTTAGFPGQVTPEGTQAVTEAVASVLGTEAIKAPG